MDPRPASLPSVTRTGVSVSGVHAACVVGAGVVAVGAAVTPRSREEEGDEFELDDLRLLGAVWMA